MSSFSRTAFGFALGLGVIATATPTVARAQCAKGAEYAQSDAVKSRYPDPSQRIDTPAFAPGKTGYTSYPEMMAFVQRLARGSRNLFVRTAGQSQEGRTIPALILTNAGRFTGPDLRTLQRPIVFLVGQLHGNEPAGGEAMLALAQSLSSGEMRPLLDRISVVMMPREKTRSASSVSGFSTFGCVAYANVKSYDCTESNFSTQRVATLNSCASTKMSGVYS